MASLFRIRSSLMATPSSIAVKSLKSNLIYSQFYSSPSETVSQASRVSSSLLNVESFTPLHRLNSPPGTKSKGFIVKTTPKISVVFRSLDRRSPSGGDGENGSAFVTRGGETATPAKMTIALSTFDRPIFDDKFEGKIVRLPEKRTLFTVLRSPHVHKKSREQFEIRVKKQLMVIQTTEKNEWKRKLFWLKNGRQFLN